MNSNQSNQAPIQETSSLEAALLRESQNSLPEYVGIHAYSDPPTVEKIDTIKKYGLLTFSSKSVTIQDATNAKLKKSSRIG